MAGEAILAFVPDLMFNVQLREAAAKGQNTIALVGTRDEYYQRLTQVHPALVVLDLAAVGADLERLVEKAKAAGGKVIAYGPHVQKELFSRAERAGCDAVYPNGKFKMDTYDILLEWLRK